MNLGSHIHQSETVSTEESHPPHTLSNLVKAPLLQYVALYRGTALFTNDFHACKGTNGWTIPKGMKEIYSGCGTEPTKGGLISKQLGWSSWCKIYPMQKCKVY